MTSRENPPRQAGEDKGAPAGRQAPLQGAFDMVQGHGGRPFEHLVDALADHVRIIARDYTIVWANTVTERVFGPGVVGKRCYEVYRARRSVCEDCVVTGAFEDGRIHDHEAVVIRPDGRSMVFWCTASVLGRLPDGRPSHVIKISRDITDRKRIEEDRERQLAGLRALQSRIDAIRRPLPMCSQCKKVRDEMGNWEPIEVCLDRLLGLKFSHGLCPACVRELYPDLCPPDA